MTTPQGGAGPELSLAGDSNAVAMLAFGEVLGGSFWPIFGILSQAIIAGALVWHLSASRRAGRFEVSAGMVILGVAGALMGVVFAVVHRDWMMVIMEAIAMIVGVRLLALVRHEEPVVPQSEKPRLPVVAPDSAEIKLSSIQPRPPQR